MKELNIRQAALADANLLVVLASVTFYEAYFEIHDQKEIADYIIRKYSLEQIKTELSDPDSVFFIPEIDGKAVGFAKLRENSKPSCLENEHTIELHRIYILERVWRSGVGSALIEKCLAESKQRGYNSMWLATWKDNHRAQKFYGKMGFTKAGEFQYDYESTKVTNFVFVKRI